MKRALVVTFFLIVVALGSAVAALAGVAPSMSLKVPFAFYAGKDLLPAGDYIIEMYKASGLSGSGATMAIRTRDGSVFRFLQATPRVSRETNPPYYVTFTQYGGTYFLSKVRNSSVEATMPKTNLEKEVAAAWLKELRENDSKGVVIGGMTN